jgi:4-hydroxythreonine-4-phosphate dehydrogenase
VRVASALALQGQAQALVTAPLSKEALKMAGERHPGHTELLAELAGLKPHQVGMLLAGGGLRVFLVTRHQSLLSAIAGLTPVAVAGAARLCGRGLNLSFGILRPRLALAALNPHAGEAGAFGDEERRILAPALRQLRRQRGFSIAGPLPADTVFVQAVRGDYDAVLCLYHDQGLIPLKLLAFESGVNVTLGLPFVRTSPDHGTAYDIAGRGRAHAGSMKAALRLAVDMAARRRAR